MTCWPSFRTACGSTSGMWPNGFDGWLFGIDSSRIKDEAVRERVILYQRECYQVLYDHFPYRNTLTK